MRKRFIGSKQITNHTGTLPSTTLSILDSKEKTTAAGPALPEGPPVWHEQTALTARRTRTPEHGVQAEYIITSDSDVPRRSITPRLAARWSPGPVITKRRYTNASRENAKAKLSQRPRAFRPGGRRVCPLCPGDSCPVLPADGREGLGHWISNALFLILAFHDPKSFR